MAARLVALGVSIHAPREGRDHGGDAELAQELAFQSTRPVKGATRTRQAEHPACSVSIHAPREGRDFAAH